MTEGQGIKLFRIRDSYHAVDGWHEKDAELDGRGLLVVGWVVTDDGTYTHIANTQDPTLDMYAGGLVVPNVAILEVTDLIGKFGGFK